MCPKNFGSGRVDSSPRVWCSRLNLSQIFVLTCSGIASATGTHFAVYVAAVRHSGAYVPVYFYVAQASSNHVATIQRIGGKKNQCRPRLSLLTGMPDGPDIISPMHKAEVTTADL
jgi:hypothetical protein